MHLDAEGLSSEEKTDAGENHDKTNALPPDDMRCGNHEAEGLSRALRSVGVGCLCTKQIIVA